MPFNAPALPHCITFNKDAINQIITMRGVAVRMYPAINSNGQLTLVVVGVSETGENIIELADTNNAPSFGLQSQKTLASGLVDEGQTSPP